MAIVEITGASLPAGIPWSKLPDKSPRKREVVVVGYPSEKSGVGSLTEKADRDVVFGGVYNVKRLQPGVMMQEANAILHDASTLAGNSGSGACQHNFHFC